MLSYRLRPLLGTALFTAMAVLSACGGAPEGGEGAPGSTDDGAAAGRATPSAGDTGPDARAATDLPEGVEARSFLGQELRSPDLPDDVRATYMARYAEAEAALEETPEDVEALIWMGRRTAYLGWYRDAISLYTHALTLHPDDPRLYRHRGHRYITVRELDHAIDDLRTAARLTEGVPDEVEPDGLPNAAGVPTSTLQFNIWYHLGLAYYLAGDFESAAEAYARCADVSVHPDSKVATAYWRTMTLLRLGREDEARAVMEAVTPDMEVIESGGYLDLVLLFKGERTPEDILGDADADPTLAGTTATYGTGAFMLLQGNEEEAERLFRLNLAGLSQWAAFGYIASEAEIAGLGAR